MPRKTTAEAAIAADEDAAAEAASRLGGVGARQGANCGRNWRRSTKCLQLAKQHAARPDARIAWLVDWIRSNMAPGGRWNDRRLILFTEWEDTRRWLQRRLLEALDDTDRIDERIDVFTGATGADRREAVKIAFNADPATRAAAHPDLHRCRPRRASICKPAVTI